MYSTKELFQHVQVSSASQKPRVAIRRAPGIELKDAEIALLQYYFPENGAIFIERAFQSGYSGALVLLVSPGSGQAPVVIKLAPPDDLAREYQAYHQHVAMSLPQNTARLQAEPLLAEDGRLGLLCYTFAGGDPSSSTNSLQSYYETKGSVATTDVLTRVFRVYGRNWWAVNHPQHFILGEQYDRFLPVHLQLTLITPESAQSEPPSSNAKTVHTARARRTSSIALREFAIGDRVRLSDFRVAKINHDTQTMLLMAEAPAGEASAPIRLRVESEQPLAYQLGDLIETLDGTVNATRLTILAEAISATLPEFEVDAPFVEETLIGSSLAPLKNPIHDLDKLLDRVLETKVSTIHGDLNLQNILVDEATGFAWLIDFAETRVGPTFIDLQRLEAQVITKLLPQVMDQSAANIKGVAELIESLHVDLPTPVASDPALQEPHTLLVNIRRLARHYLMIDEEWDEYYLGLVVVMLGVLKFEELDATARQLALIWMTVAHNLIGKPLRTELPTASSEPVAGTSPFKGLQYFEEEDAEIFFGREVLTAQLVNHLHRRRFLAVIGASGSGKSSLVRAGLVPALKKGQPLVDGTLPPAGSIHWPVRVMTPEAHPLESLATMLVPEGESMRAITEFMDDMAADPRSLHLYIRRMFNRGDFSSETERLLLVVDQFEETFTLCRDREERKAFIDNLLLASRTDGPTVVVITLRADFYVYCSEFEELRLALEKWQRYIGPMTESELRRAIEAPARQGGWEFEPRLVNQLLRDVGDEPGALPLLSHALLETWNRRSGRTLTFAGYAESGGVQGAIAQTAEKVFTDNLDDEQQAIAREIFLQLTELGEGAQDTRRRVALSELTTLSQSRSTVEQVLQILTDARLVTTAEDTAEVAHEALIREWPTLREWLSDNREGLRIQRRLTEDAREWIVLGRDTGALYRGVRLEQVIEWYQEFQGRLGPQEQEFLEASRAEVQAREQAREEARQRETEHRQELAAERARVEEQAKSGNRLKRLALGLAAMVLMAIIATGFVLYQRGQLNTQNMELENTNRKLEDTVKMAEDAEKQANINATEARANAQEALTNAQDAQKAQAEAEKLKELLRADQLAAKALTIGQQRPQYALLLALEAFGIQERQSAPHSPTVEQSLRDLLGQISGTSLQSHHETIRTAVFSHDGKWIATGGDDDFLYLWQTEEPDQKPVRLVGHDSDVNVARFSPNDQWLASAGDDTRIIVWNLAEPLEDVSTYEFEILYGHQDDINDLAISSDGRWLAAGGDDAIVSLWDTQNLVRGPIILRGHSEEVWDLEFSPDSRLIASASADHTVQILELENPYQDPILLFAHDDDVNGLSFSADSHWLATAGDDGIAKIWDMQNLDAEPTTLEGHIDALIATAFSPDGRWLATTGEDTTVRVWDMQSLTALPAVLRGHDDLVGFARFSPDNQWLITASADNTVRLWYLQNLDNPPIILRGHEDVVNDIQISQDGRWLLTASSDNTARLWEMTHLSDSPSILRGHNRDLLDVAFSPDGRWLVTTSIDSTARVWDVGNPEHDGAILQQKNQKRIRKMLFSPSGQWLVTGGDDNAARLWPVGDFDAGINQAVPEPIVLQGHEKRIRALAFSSDERWLASGSDDDTIRLWDITTSESEPLVLSGHEDWVAALAFSPDDKWLASTSRDGTSRLWEMQQLDAEPILLEGHRGRIRDIAFSPDGQWIATVASEGLALLWHLDTLDLEDPNQNVVVLESHTEAIWDLAFSPNGRWLATASSDRTARVWDMQEIRSDGTWQAPFIFREHTDRVWRVTFSADSRWLATASFDNIARIWDMNDPARDPKVLSGHRGDVNSVAFSPDGSWVATGSTDQTARLWPMQLGRLMALACHKSGRNLNLDEWEQHFSDEDYRKTCVESPIHHSVTQPFVDAGRELALAGNIEEAAAQLQLAINLDSDLKFDPKQEAQYIADLATAKALEREGLHLAKDGDVEGATERFTKAMELAPQLRIQPEAEARRLRALSLVDQGQDLARLDGDFEGAKAKFQEALTFEPELPLDPEEDAKRMAAPALIRRGKSMSYGGNIKGALASFTLAQELIPTVEISASDWHVLCFWGSLYNFAEDVIDTCDTALEMVSPDRVPIYRNSRGIARALTGNQQGAIEDLTVYKEHLEATMGESQDESFPQEQWIAMLQEGENPFTEEVLEQLRNE